MNKTQWMTGSLTALALLASGAASAQIQPQLRYPQDQGDLPDDAQAPEDQADPPHADDDFSDVVGADQDASAPDSAPGGYDRAHDPNDAALAPESDAAIDDCALAARDEAERDGGYAEIRQMQPPRESANGYDVEGDAEVRSSWRAQDGAMRHFTCSIRNGRIASVYFQQERMAR
ncbi:hypothetical protein [Sphingobium estronivorans]|uniref:hypothetical protein n=1 Tax=Sphingobium estronivorans TaxID=1577690 RepID=UPI00123A676D|nr:hypothetical protein [Sphingobium estronivorans]